MFYHWFLDEPDPAAREVQMAKLRSSERSDRSHPFSHNLLHIQHLIKQSDQNHENTASMIKSSSNTNKWIFVQLASWQTQYHLWLASTSAGWSESSSWAAWPLARTSRRSSWCSPAEGGIWMYELLATQYLEMCDPSRHEQKHKAQPTFPPPWRPLWPPW